MSTSSAQPNPGTSRIFRALTLCMFVAVTIFITKAASGCDDRSTEEACCDLATDTEPASANAGTATGPASSPASSERANPGSTQTNNKNAVPDKGNTAKEPVFLPATKSAPLPVFELKAPGDLGIGSQRRSRPSLNVGAQSAE